MVRNSGILVIYVQFIRGEKKKAAKLVEFSLLLAFVRFVLLMIYFAAHIAKGRPSVIHSHNT